MHILYGRLRTKYDVNYETMINIKLITNPIKKRPGMPNKYTVREDEDT